MNSHGNDDAPLRLVTRVGAPHPRVSEAMRIVARIFLRIARQKHLETGSSLSGHVEAPGDPPAPEKTP